MKKWPLFVGIALLVTGILLRIFSDLGFKAILVIIAGASFKISYVIAKIRRGEYKPGIEMVLLYVGVSFFFTGVYFRYHPSVFRPVYLMAPGIALKLYFVVTFILKSKNNPQEQTIKQVIRD